MKLSHIGVLGMGIWIAAIGIVGATDFTLPGIGTMKVPKNVVVEAGIPRSVFFEKAGGMKRFFTRRGGTDDVYYIMTYAKPPDFSYGWATSQTLGVPYLLEAGLSRYKDFPAEDRMDIIAHNLNDKLKEAQVIYMGAEPLTKSADKKHPRWEGVVTFFERERDIVYRQTIHIVLQSDGMFVRMGALVSDEEQKEFTRALEKMLEGRSFLKKEKKYFQIRSSAIDKNSYNQ